MGSHVEYESQDWTRAFTLSLNVQSTLSTTIAALRVENGIEASNISSSSADGGDGDGDGGTSSSTTLSPARSLSLRPSEVASSLLTAMTYMAEWCLSRAVELPSKRPSNAYATASARADSTLASAAQGDFVVMGRPRRVVTHAITTSAAPAAAAVSVAGATTPDVHTSSSNFSSPGSGTAPAATIIGGFGVAHTDTDFDMLTTTAAPSPSRSGASSPKSPRYDSSQGLRTRRTFLGTFGPCTDVVYSVASGPTSYHYPAHRFVADAAVQIALASAVEVAVVEPCRGDGVGATAVARNDGIVAAARRAFVAPTSSSSSSSSLSQLSASSSLHQHVAAQVLQPADATDATHLSLTLSLDPASMLLANCAPLISPRVQLLRRVATDVDGVIGGGGGGGGTSIINSLRSHPPNHTIADRQLLSLALLDHPLRTIVMAYQFHAGLWVRNGSASVQGQVLHYFKRNSGHSPSLFDSDVHAVQLGVLMMMANSNNSDNSSGYISPSSGRSGSSMIGGVHSSPSSSRICTGGPQAALQALLNRFELREWFEGIYDAVDPTSSSSTDRLQYGMKRAAILTTEAIGTVLPRQQPSKEDLTEKEKGAMVPLFLRFLAILTTELPVCDVPLSSASASAASLRSSSSSSAVSPPNAPFAVVEGHYASVAHKHGAGLSLEDEEAALDATLAADVSSSAAAPVIALGVIPATTASARASASTPSKRQRPVRSSSSGAGAGGAGSKAVADTVMDEGADADGADADEDADMEAEAEGDGNSNGGGGGGVVGIGATTTGNDGSAAMSTSTSPESLPSPPRTRSAAAAGIGSSGNGDAGTGASASASSSALLSGLGGDAGIALSPAAATALSRAASAASPSQPLLQCKFTITRTAADISSSSATISLRRELVHALAAGPQPRSALINAAMAVYHRIKSSRTAVDDVAMSTVLSAISDYRPPAGMEAGVYVIKDSILASEYDYTYRHLSPRKHVQAREAWAAARRKLAASSSSSASAAPLHLGSVAGVGGAGAAALPLVPAPPPSLHSFTPIRRLLHTVAHAHIIKSIFMDADCGGGGDRGGDSALIGAMHTLTLALHTWPGGPNLGTTAAPPGTAASAGAGADAEGGAATSGTSGGAAEPTVADVFAECLCAATIILPYGGSESSVIPPIRSTVTGSAAVLLKANEAGGRGTADVTVQDDVYTVTSCLRADDTCASIVQHLTGPSIITLLHRLATSSSSSSSSSDSASSASSAPSLVAPPSSAAGAPSSSPSASAAASAAIGAVMKSISGNTNGGARYTKPSQTRGPAPPEVAEAARWCLSRLAMLHPLTAAEVARVVDEHAAATASQRAADASSSATSSSTSGADGASGGAGADSADAAAKRKAEIEKRKKEAQARAMAVLAAKQQSFMKAQSMLGSEEEEEEEEEDEDMGDGGADEVDGGPASAAAAAAAAAEAAADAAEAQRLSQLLGGKHLLAAATAAAGSGTTVAIAAAQGGKSPVKTPKGKRSSGAAAARTPSAATPGGGGGGGANKASLSSTSPTTLALRSLHAPLPPPRCILCGEEDADKPAAYFALAEVGSA